MLEGFSYYAFISYSHRDAKRARWLHNAIENYRLPRQLVGEETLVGETPMRLNPVFRDREELPSASDLSEVISAAIERSQTLIVICSPDAATSRWVNAEILAFKRQGREDRIFCLVVDGEPNSGGETECFPEALRFKLGPDGELSDEPAEPIAADIRPGKDPRNAAKLKLIAGVLGVGYDALRRRELHRRNRRMAYVSAAALTGMVITSGLAAAALIARSDAETQRERAEAEAETARQTAGFLVDLFKVSDPSEARGNTITAREILDKGSQRIDEELADQPDVQAQLMTTMGSVYKSLGLYQEADRLLDSALSKRRVLGDGSDEMVASLTELAEVRRLTAQYEAAEAMYQEAIAAAEAGGEDEIANLAIARSGLGEVLTEQGRFEEAQLLFEQALAARRGLYGNEHLLTARSAELLALNRMDVGRLGEAEVLQREAVSIVEQMVDGEPHPQLAEALNNLGFTLHARGKTDEARELFERSVDMTRFLVGDVHPSVAVGVNNLAFLALESERYEEAERLFREVIDMNIQLLGSEHPEVADGKMNLAFALYQQEKLDAAFAMGDESLVIYQQNFPDGHPEVARVLTNLGSWHGDAFDYEIAEAMLTEALAMSQQLFEEDNVAIAFTGAALAQVMLNLGRADEALELAEQARTLFSRALPVGHWRTAWANSIAGAALTDLGELDEAGPRLEQAYDALRSNPDARDSAVAYAREYLQIYYQRIKRDDLAQGLAAASQ